MNETTELQPQSDTSPELAEPVPSPSVLRILLGWTREILETVIPAVLIALFINLFVAQATEVRGQSMEPNLHQDQRLVVEKVSYRFHGPRRGDVVILDLPEVSDELLIKRVVGLPGERIEITDGIVYIDGAPLPETYLKDRPRGNYSATVIPPLHIFVLGDNRSFSNDSRSFGPVPLDAVLGHAWLSYWPFESLGLIR